MTRERAVAGVVLAFAAAAIVAGWATKPYDQAVWRQRLDDAHTAWEADRTALQSAHLTGQDRRQLLAQCNQAIADYQTAAAHLTTTPPYDPDLECTP